MSLRNIFKIRPILTLLVLCALAGASPVFSQTTDSTAVSNTTATAADAAATTPSASTEKLISLDVDTTTLSWAGGGVGAPKPEVDNSALYKSAGYYTLLFLLLCVFLGIVGKVLKVYEVTNEIQGKESKINWNRVQGILFGVALIAGIYGTYWSYSVQGPMSIHETASVHGEKLDFMFHVTWIITTIVFILTHILLFGFSFLYSSSDKKKAYFYPHNNTVERIWTIVPAFVLTILVLLGFFTWRSITNVSPEDQKKAISVEVTGEQFKWNIRYAGDDNQLGLKNYKLIDANNNLGIDYKDQKSWDDKMADELVIPVGRPVRVTVSSKDILHSFYLPAFKVQINAVPGMPTYFQFTPTMTTAEIRVKRNNPTFDYSLVCAKICGAGHYRMQGKITVVTEAEYQQWLAQQALFYSDDVKSQMQTAQKAQAAKDNKIALNK